MDLIGGLSDTNVIAGCIRFQVFFNSNFKRSQDLSYLYSYSNLLNIPKKKKDFVE